MLPSLCKYSLGVVLALGFSSCFWVGSAVLLSGCFMCDGVGRIKQTRKSTAHREKQVLSALGETTCAAGSVGLGGMQIRQR